MAELQRLVHWATAPPTSGEVQTWYARMVHLLDQHRRRQDEAGTFARTLDREMGALWTFVVEEGVEPTNNRAERALRFAVLWRKIMPGQLQCEGRSLGGAHPLATGDLPPPGHPHVSRLGRRGHLLLQRPAS